MVATEDGGHGRWWPRKMVAMEDGGHGRWWPRKMVATEDGGPHGFDISLISMCVLYAYTLSHYSP